MSTYYSIFGTEQTIRLQRYKEKLVSPDRIGSGANKGNGKSTQQVEHCCFCTPGTMGSQCGHTFEIGQPDRHEHIQSDDTRPDPAVKAQYQQDRCYDLTYIDAVCQNIRQAVPDKHSFNRSNAVLQLTDAMKEQHASYHKTQNEFSDIVWHSVVPHLIILKKIIALFYHCITVEYKSMTI